MIRNNFLFKKVNSFNQKPFAAFWLFSGMLVSSVGYAQDVGSDTISEAIVTSVGHLDEYIAFPESPAIEETIEFQSVISQATQFQAASSTDESSQSDSPTDDPSQDLGSIGTNYRELLTLDHEVTPYTDAMFGEVIGLSTGSLNFKQTDASIPGNFSLPVEVTRTYIGLDGLETNTRDFGTWGFDLPHVRSSMMTDDSSSPRTFFGSWADGIACSGQLGDVGNYEPALGTDMTFEKGQSFWNGDSISLPGKGVEKIIRSGSEKLTKNFWKIECVDSADGYEGFSITTPDGTNYVLDKLRLVKGRSLKLKLNNTTEPSYKTYRIYQAFMLPTKVTDRFGNTVTYEWGQNSRLESITSSDNRKITIQYYSSGDFTNLVKDVYAHKASDEYTSGRHWKYQYVDLGSIPKFGNVYGLEKVTRPDSKYWSFEGPTANDSLIGAHSSNADPIVTCDFIGGLTKGGSVSITSPEGVKATYSYSERTFRRSNTPDTWLSNPWTGIIEDPRTSLEIWDKYSLCPLTYSLNKKVISGPGLPSRAWTYNYKGTLGYHEGDPNKSVNVDRLYYDAISLPTIPHDLTVDDLKSTIVTAPDGSKMAHHFSAFFDWTENFELITDYYDTDGSTLLKQVTREYESTARRGVSHVHDDIYAGFVKLSKKINTNLNYSDSTDVFEVSYESYNDYDAPLVIKETFGTNVRYTKQGYHHDTTNWLLNLPTTTEISDTSDDYTTVSEIEYYSADDTSFPNLPKYEKRFGTWQKYIKSYTAEGNEETIEFNQALSSNVNENRFQTFSSYYRGIPRNISISKRTSSGSITASRTVDDFGAVTYIKDFNGNETDYRYDELGRIKVINLREKTGEPNWLGTAYTWSYNGGNSSNQPVRTMSQCQINEELTGCEADSTKVSTSTTFDGFLRPTLTAATDSDSNVTIYQHMSYDIYGNTLSRSYSSYSLDDTQGVSNVYDGLSRLRSETIYGLGTATTQYLAGNKIKVTDARDYETTTTYLAYGQPSYEQATTIESPESVVTNIDIDIFGNITSIKQSGLNETEEVSLTEYRAYDSQKRLCQIYRADVGGTVMSRNSIGEVQWIAQGQSVDDSTVCDTDSDQSEDKDKVSFAYDNLGALRTISYGDSTPTRTYSYDNNGNVKTISAAGYNQRYNYNSQDLLTDETLTIDGKELKLDYDYTPLGHLSSVQYPVEGLPHVSFSPNGFGQPTQAIRVYEDESIKNVFVKGGTDKAEYHPNGAIYTFTYGNGIEHKTTLNTANVPYSIKDTGTDISPVDLTYGYDNNLNITSIANPREANSFALSSLTYDGLDRLIATEGGAGIGSSTITYDGLGNIRTYNVEGGYSPSDLTYHYNANNRLSSVVTTDTTDVVRDFSGDNDYDTRGNVLSNGTRKFTYNLANQMTASGSSRFTYDGHNRRIKSVKDNGDIEYSMYSQSGKLMYRETKDGGINYVFLGNKLVAREGTGAVANENSIMNYKPYGESIELANDDVGYTGHKFDTDLGLSYMQARYYDPVIGRFYSNDPAGFTGEVDTFNRYSYVGNNPYKYVDPDGNSKVAMLIELTKNGSRNIRSLTASQAIRARQNGQNIKMIDGNKSSALAIERAANNGSTANILKGGDHAKGHIINKKDVAQGAKPIRGQPHVQTDDVQGHTFYSISTTAVNGVLNAVADGLEGAAKGMEWAQDNMPKTMAVIEGAVTILDPTRGVEAPIKTDECEDCI